jgi:hypothetical protein
VLHSHVQRQRFDEVAVEWARAGFDAADAQLWRQLGLKPAEASGSSVTAALRRRRSATGGVPLSPFDELAEWIGAGLTAVEAVEQRSRGVTAERATARRVRRDDDAS